MRYKKTFAILGLWLLMIVPAHANKIAVANYHANDSAEKVFSAVMRVLTKERYAVRFTDESKGTVQANKTARLDGAEWASVFIRIKPDSEGTSIEATFTRHAATIAGGSPPDWAKRFGNDLKIAFPDLSVQIEKQ